MKTLKKLPMNIFTVLVVAAALGILFRAINIVTFNDKNASAIMSAEAQGDEKPLTEAEKLKKDVQKSVDETVKNLGTEDGKKPLSAADAKAVDAAKEAGAKDPKESANKEEGPDSIKAPSSMPGDTSSDQRAFSAPEIEVLQSLSKRRDDLDKREQKIAAREALLTAGEEEVDRKVGELNKLKTDIEKLLGQQQDMEDSRITSLVKIYEGMKPKDAANIFNTLDMDVLLAVIGRMKEAKSSPVLAAMDPEKARIVTIKLAEQRKLPSLPEKKAAPAAPMPAPPAADEGAAEPAAPASN